ncbi:MAG: hypothetical protein OEN23_08410 [Paracoccaceae bacterium]|nr:hypothetical protein [Paracoccaceae bacterium]
MIRLLILALAVMALAVPVEAAEKAGYYYPPITSEESFSRDLGGPPADRRVRVNFITQITKAQLAAPENPRFVIFAKGADAQHMIIVALDDEVFKTLYRARAVLAQLTSNARGTDFFIENGIEDFATWFDLARLLGFEDLVISDGETWAHNVKFD